MQETFPDHSESINDIMAALSKAQAVMSAASKDSSNPYYNSKYADLNSVWNACRDALSKHGLAVTQTMQYKADGSLQLVTILGHLSGQWIKSYLPIRYSENVTEINKYGKEVKANPLQKLGSCLTYLRRYALAAIVGVAPDEDDDGNNMAGEPFPQQAVSGPSQQKNVQTATTYAKISPAQVKQLREVISSDYESELLKYFGNKVGAKSLEDIPAVNFNDIYKAAVKRMEKQLLESGEFIEEIAQ